MPIYITLPVALAAGYVAVWAVLGAYYVFALVVLG